MTSPGPGDRLPILHLTSYPFARHSHPANYRVINGLGAHFPAVVLAGNNPGYFAAESDLPGMSAPGIRAVHQVEPQRCAEDQYAWELAAVLRQQHGAFAGVIGHIGASGWRVLPVARLLSAPILTLFHGADADADLRSEREATHFDRLRRSPAAFFLGVSKNLVIRLLDFGMPPERTLLHHLGIDLDRYPLPPRAGANRRRIVMAGRFRPQKGQELALRAYAQFVRRFPDWSLDLFGSGGNEPEKDLGRKLVALTREMGLDGSVRFRGAVPADLLQAEFAAADIMLHTSIHARENDRVEGLPNVVLEAMATGLPVVGTRQAGLPEAVLHEQTGLLVDESDVVGLAAALGRLASDLALRLRFGRAGRRRIETEFDAVRQSQRLAERVREMQELYAALDPREREVAWCASAGGERLVNA